MVVVVSGEEEAVRTNMEAGEEADESRKERKNVNTRHLAGWEPTPLPGPHLNTASADRLGPGVPPCLRLRLVLNAHHQRLR